jgi:hypothetical protein
MGQVVFTFDICASMVLSNSSCPGYTAKWPFQTSLQHTTPVASPSDLPPGTFNSSILSDFIATSTAPDIVHRLSSSHARMSVGHAVRDALDDGL